MKYIFIFVLILASCYSSQKVTESQSKSSKHSSFELQNEKQINKLHDEYTTISGQVDSIREETTTKDGSVTRTYYGIRQDQKSGSNQKDEYIEIQNQRVETTDVQAQGSSSKSESTINVESAEVSVAKSDKWKYITISLVVLLILVIYISNRGHEWLTKRNQNQQI